MDWQEGTFPWNQQGQAEGHAARHMASRMGVRVMAVVGLGRQGSPCLPPSLPPCTPGTTGSAGV